MSYDQRTDEKFAVPRRSSAEFGFPVWPKLSFKIESLVHENTLRCVGSEPVALSSFQPRMLAVMLAVPAPLSRLIAGVIQLKIAIVG